MERSPFGELNHIGKWPNAIELLIASSFYFINEVMYDVVVQLYKYINKTNTNENNFVLQLWKITPHKLIK